MTREEMALLQAKAAIPIREGWAAGALSCWVPGIPAHFKNKAIQWGASGAVKHKKEWRERAANRLLPYRAGADIPWPWLPKRPKLVTFCVYGRSMFDEDNLQLVCSPCRDALTDMRLIDDDRKSSGHVFVYTQAQPKRKVGPWGVAITIRVAVASALSEAKQENPSVSGP